MANVKLSAIASGSAANSATDTMVAVRSGTTDVLVSVGNLISVTAATGVAAFLTTPSSANLLAAVTDETGTGALVFANGPTLIAPALGTPASGVATNLTGTAAGLTAGNVTTNANLTGAITSVGNATSLGSFTSAQLLGALTDETGTGVAVFNNGPTLIAPILGTPASGVATNLTGTAAALNIGGSAASLSVSGQTGLMTVTGLASTNRIKTVRDAADTLLELGGSYTPTGTWTNMALVTPTVSQINNVNTTGVAQKRRTDAAFATVGNVFENILCFQGIAFTFTVTMTIAAPCVVTLTAHGLNTGSAVHFTTTGALPTGITANTTYYVVFVSANAFNLATSVANAWAGTLITTTGSQSGTQTIVHGVSAANNTPADIQGFRPGAGTWLCWTTNSWLGVSTAIMTGMLSGLVKNTSLNPFAFMNTSSSYLNGLSWAAGSLVLSGTSPTLITTNSTDIVYVGNTVFFGSGGSVNMNTTLQFMGIN